MNKKSEDKNSALDKVNRDEFVSFMRSLTVVLLAKMLLVAKPRIVNDRESLLTLVSSFFRLESFTALEKMISGKDHLHHDKVALQLKMLWDEYVKKSVKVVRIDSKRDFIFEFCLCEKFERNIKGAKKKTPFITFLNFYDKIFVKTAETETMMSLIMLLDEDLVNKINMVSTHLRDDHDFPDVEELLESKQKRKKDKPKNTPAKVPPPERSLKEIYAQKKRSSDSYQNGHGSNGFTNAPPMSNVIEFSQTQNLSQQAVLDNQKLMRSFYEKCQLRHSMTYDYHYLIVYISIRLGRDPEMTATAISSGLILLSALIKEYETKFPHTV